jgi:hypothetical protein
MNLAADTEPPYVHDLTPAQLLALQANAAARLDCGIAFRDALDDGTRGPELRLIPAGVFEMGAKPEDRGFGEQLLTGSKSTGPSPWAVFASPPRSSVFSRGRRVLSGPTTWSWRRAAAR